MVRSSGIYKYLLLVMVLLITSAVIGSGAVSCQSASGSGAASSCAGSVSGTQLGTSGAKVPLAADPSSTQFTTGSPSTSTTPSSTTNGVGSGSGVPLNGALVLSLVAISAGVVFYAGARIFGRRVQETKT